MIITILKKDKFLFSCYFASVTSSTIKLPISNVQRVLRYLKISNVKKLQMLMELTVLAIPVLFYCLYCSCLSVLPLCGVCLLVVCNAACVCMCAISPITKFHLRVS